MFHGDDAFSSAETISGHDLTVGQYQYDPAHGSEDNYTYNPDQTLAAVNLDKGGSPVSAEDYTYDAQGRLSTLDANGTTFTYGYADTGLLHTVTSSTGVTTTYGYDTATENLTSITVTNASDTTLYSVAYEYNNANQITSAAVTSTDAGGTTTTTDWAYTYDNMSQLQSAIASVGGTPVSGQDYTYTYDAAGNETGQGTVNDMNQLAADTYDGRGDVTDDGKSSYAYNPLGQLISVTPDSPTSGSQEVTYDYDDQGRMTIRNAYSWDSGTDSWSGTATATKFAYDGTSLIGTFNVTVSGGVETDTPVQTYTWGANGLQTIQIWNSGGTSVVKTLIPVADAGGNIVMLVNAADGSINATYTYDPYGNLIGSSGTVADSPFQFGGQNGTYTDAATGLVLMGARWYSPAQRRFLTEDPSGQDGGLNTYEYADNDPVNESDPTGLAPAATQPVSASTPAAALESVPEFPLLHASNTLPELNTSNFSDQQKRILSKVDQWTDFTPQQKIALKMGIVADWIQQQLNSLQAENGKELPQSILSRLVKDLLCADDDEEADTIDNSIEIDKLKAALDVISKTFYSSGLGQVDLISSRDRDRHGPVYGLDAAMYLVDSWDSSYNIIGPPPEEAIYSTGDEVKVAVALFTAGRSLFLDSAESAAAENTVTVTHFTDEAGMNAISASQTVGTSSIQPYVTLPSEIPAGSTAADVENLLEISPEKGQYSITFETPESNLITPANGPTTSSGATQFQLLNPQPINPADFVETPR